MIYQLYDILRKYPCLDSTLNLTGAKATSAYVDALYLTFDHSAYTLDVGMPFTLRLQMRVADVHAGQIAFAANLANMCHVLHLLINGRVVPARTIMVF